MFAPTKRLRKMLRSTVLRPMFECRHYEVSLIASQDDDPARPSERLFEVATGAITAAQNLQLPATASRVQTPPCWPEIWPGEHYRLLAALVQMLQPATVVEIGTYTGLSSLAMLERLPADSRLVTFDILPWHEIGHTCLRDEDFQDGRLQQVLADLANPSSFQKYTELLQSAQLIFVDGPKNIEFEEQFLSLLNGIDLPERPLVVFDDIRLWNMLHIWRAIRRPKLDLTSFGHWSGTGLVDWT